MKAKRILSIVLLLCTLLSLLPAGMIGVWASETENETPKEDAAEKIEATFPDYKIGSTQTIENDGYIGIPLELSIYFDKANNRVTSGYGGTPIIIYVVNANFERIGTDTDEEIITSMLERGYVVVVLDYLNNEKAKSPDLDWSVQGIRNKVKSKTYFTDPIFPSGTYYDNYVVPAGCDVSLYNVFWEADKHGADGTLEKIVENWNNDFRGGKPEKLVKWVRPDGTRKKTLAKAADGSTPVWYDASGKVDENGQYTKVKYTLAETITDCVNPDGTPIDLNLYIHIVYPTSPEKEVPVMSIANSSGYLASCVQSADRPHMNGFLFNGYAGVMFDYLYVPMANDNSFGYYDGNPNNYPGAVSGDQMTYSVHIYNNAKIDTAAMRYLRYTSLAGGDRYNFDLDSFGVYGNSKGGWMNLLGEAKLQSGLVKNPESYGSAEELDEAINDAITAIADHRALDNHHGESRYDNGITASYTVDGFTVDGGERQPWLSYEGEEIISGVQLDYPSNGPNMAYITEGHSATFQVAHMADDYNAAFGGANTYVNGAMAMDVPCMFFEVPLGHTLTSGLDMNYNVDTYAALFAFAAYHLKGEATKVMYTDPLSGSVIDVNAPITVMFTGQVSAEEIEKVTLTDADGNVISGTWSSGYGKLQWTFRPDGMKGSTAYTLTVPAELCGDNGATMGEAYVSNFYTYYGEESAISTVKGTEGDYIYLTAPALPEAANGFVIRFKADGANVAKLYAVSGFDASNPDTATKGELIGSVNLRGAGYYEIDVTEYVAGVAGETVAFLLQGGKTAGEIVKYASDFSASLGSCKKANYSSVTLEKAPDGTDAMKVVILDNEGRYVNHTFYSNMTTAFTVTNPFGFTITEADYGRTFTVKARIYDTVSRVIEFKLNSNTSSANEILDYQQGIYHYTTVAGEWIDIEFTYSVYDPDYGKTGLRTKGITVQAEDTGDLEMPFYVDGLSVTETVNEFNATNIAFSAVNDGNADYKAPVADAPFAIYEGGAKVAEYDSWKAALTACKAGQTVVLQSNYVFTDSDIYDGFAGGASFDIDLNGYTVTCANTKNSLLWIKSTSATATAIVIKNGAILINDTPLMSYESSTTAGSGKNVALTLDEVTIGVVDGAMAKNVITAPTISAGSVNVSVTLNDCEINLPDDKISEEYWTLFGQGSGAVKATYAVNGGNISLTSMRRVKIHDSFKAVEFGKGSDGKITTVTMHSCSLPNSDMSYITAGGVSSTVATSTVDNITTYELIAGDLSTKYGIIPEKYADVNAYPFVIFDANGTCLGASAYYAKDNGGGIMNIAAKQTEGEWFIVLRRDFDYTESQFNNISFVYGSVTLDLGGHTFSCQSSGRWLESHGKRAGVLNYTIKNGTVEVGTNPMIRFAGGTTDAYDGVVPKTFNYTFEDVKFTDVRAESLVICGNPSIVVEGNVTMRNCEFDLTSAPAGFVMFNLNDSKGNVHSIVKIEGGVFTSEDDLAAITLSSALNANSSVTAEKNAKGEYPTAVLPTGAAAPDLNFATEDGNMAFKLADTENGFDNYTLVKNPLSTKYGVIPSAYANTTAYPFAVFKDGQFIGAYAKWGAAGTAAADAIKGTAGKGKTVYILLRSDYGNANKDTHSSFGNTAGTIVFDLDGHTFTREGVFFDLTVRASYVFDTTILVKNGTVLSYNGAIIASQYEKSTAIANKVFNLTFENVDFGYAVGATSNTPLFTVWDNSRDVKAGTINLTFDSCDFDLTTNAPSGKTCTWFNFDDKYDSVNVHATVKGGSFTASSLASVVFNKLDGTNDTVTYVKGDDGKYTTLTMPSAVTAPTTGFNSADGVMKFGKIGTDGDNTVYELILMVTKYGTIPDKYASALDYPFVYFDENGNFKGAYASFLGNNGANSVIGGAKTYLQGNVFDYDKQQYTGTIRKAYVLMRRDYTMDPDEYHDNNAQVQGELIIDLGGFNLYQNGRILFASEAKGWSGSGDAKVFHTTFTIMNGGIVLKNNYLANFSVWDSVGDGSIINKNWTYNYQNVTFSLAQGATVDGLYKFGTNSSTKQAVATFFLNFEDCIFDFDTVAPTKNFSIFTSKHAYYKMAYTVKGCEVYAGSMSNIKLVDINSNGILTAIKNAAGKYITVYVNTANKGTIPSDSFNTADGSMNFSDVGTSGTKTVFTLAKPVSTPYGDIPAGYADANEYPYAVFQNGKFLGAYAKWGDNNDGAVDSALERAKNAVTGPGGAGKTVVILVRADRTITSDEQFNNFSQIGGTLIVDLDGHTLTRNHVLFDAQAKATGDQGTHDTAFIVKNGTILSYNGAVVNLNSVTVGGKYVNPKTFYMTFENITFGLAEGATTTTPVIVAYSEADDVGVNAVAIFNNCTFDYKTVAPTKNITVFAMKESNDLTNCTVTMNGCEFIAESFDNITISSANADKDFIYFAKGDDGSYMIFKGAAPEGEFYAEDGAKLTVIPTEGGYTLSEACQHEYDNACDTECNICGEGRETEHSYEAVVTAPTCTEDGYTTYTCSACGESYVEDFVPATGHIYDDEYDADCNVCGEVREVETPVTVVAEGKCGVNTVWVLTSDGVLTISGNGDTEDYLVSITTEQPYRAYQNQITKVVIEDGVTSIGRGAFYGFTAITEVVLPESLIAIHEYAFFGCTGIKTINIPANTFYIGMYAFRKSGITEINFSTDGWKFANGVALDTANVKAFTTEMTYKQTCMRPVSDNGIVIANGVFGAKDQFTWTLSSTGVLTVSGQGNMPKFNVNTTPWYGYRGAIRSVVIEEGITSVGRCSFHTCRAITDITLPESLETIAEYAFYNCQFLAEATIPANVTRIEIFAFRKCFQLKNVTFTLNYGWSAGDTKVSATELNSNAADMLTLVNYTKIWTRDVNAEEEVLDPNYVTGGACNTTIKWALTYIDDTKTKMKLTVTGTGVMPKYDTGKTPWYGYLDNIVEVEVCEGITEIGRCSFYGLKFVTKVTLPEGLVTIGEYAFSGCFLLKSIEIPESVTTIDPTAFTKTGLTEIPTV